MSRRTGSVGKARLAVEEGIVRGVCNNVRRARTVLLRDEDFMKQVVHRRQVNDIGAAGAQTGRKALGLSIPLGGEHHTLASLERSPANLT